MTIRFFFSFRSPYAWIAAQKLKRVCGADLTPFALVPFWEPDEPSLAMLSDVGARFPYRPMSPERHLYILEDVRRLASEAGLAMKWPVDPPRPHWEKPHLAFLLARRLGREIPFFWAVYSARWEKGRDICAPEVLAEIAQDVGLDPGAIAGAHDDPELRALGITALRQAEQDRAFGVPFFVAGRERFWGQDRVEALLDRHREAITPALRPTG